MQVPVYSGSAWRGLLGHGLRRLVCVTRQPTCEGCMLRYSCLYSTFFETPRPPGMPESRYRALPHPFVLEPSISHEREISEGQSLCLGITLIGSVVEQVPYLIHALNLAGERGLGRSGGRFVVTTLQREDGLGSETWEPVYEADRGEYHRRELRPPAVPTCMSAVCIRLETPLRVKRHGHFVGVREFEAADVLRNLYARLAVLAEPLRRRPPRFRLGGG